jgi:hypothetical protein
VGVEVNDIEGDLFLTGKGLRKGDPFAPLLSNWSFKKSLFFYTYYLLYSFVHRKIVRWKKNERS